MTIKTREKKQKNCEKWAISHEEAILKWWLRLMAGLCEGFLGYWRDPGPKSKVGHGLRKQGLRILLTASTYVLVKYPKIPNNGLCTY